MPSRVGPSTLAQAAPAASTLTTIFTATRNRQLVERIEVTNREATDKTYRLSLAPAGAADATTQYFAYGQTVLAAAMFPHPVGRLLNKGDEIRAWSAGLLTYQVIGAT